MASPGFGRGGQKYFFRFGNLHVAKRHTLRMAKPCALLGGFGGVLPRKFFLNGAIWCVLMYIGILDHILSLKKFKITIFYIKKIKIHVQIHINYSCTHMLGSSGAYASCHEKILKMYCSLKCVLVYILIRLCMS